MTDLDITHDADAGRFEVVVDGSTAFLQYERLDQRTLDYRHTFVPDALRGRGIATALVQFALTHAREQGLRVVPSCPFVAAAIQRNPTYAELVAD